MKEPKKESFKTESSMKERISVLKKEGREVIDLEDLERGMFGVLASDIPLTDGSVVWEEDVVLLEWPKYGRPLKKMETKVETIEDLSGAYNEHVEHTEFKPFTDPILKTAGIVCHCLAGSGISLVFSVSLNVIKNVSPDLLREIFPELFNETNKKH